MKKIIVVVVLSLLLFLSGQINAQAKFVMDLATANPPTIYIGDFEVLNNHFVALEAVKTVGEQLSDGQLEVNILHSAVMGSLTENLEQLRMNIIQGCMTNVTQFSQFIPEVQIFNLPYVFPSSTVVWDVLDSPFAEEFFEYVRQKTGIRVLSTWGGEFRSFSNNKKPVRVPEDMRGLRIRVPESPIYIRMVEATGASAMTLPWLEVYMGLDTGVVDGQDVGPGLCLLASFHEVQKYYTINKHMADVAMLVVNDRWFQSLPPEIQFALIEGGREGSIMARGQTRIVDNYSLAFIKKYGLNVYHPTFEELSLWKEVVQEPSVNWLRGQIDEMWIDKLLAAIDESKAKLGY